MTVRVDAGVGVAGLQVAWCLIPGGKYSNIRRFPRSFTFSDQLGGWSPNETEIFMAPLPERKAPDLLPSRSISRSGGVCDSVCERKLLPCLSNQARLRAWLKQRLRANRVTADGVRTAAARTCVCVCLCACKTFKPLLSG